VSLDYPKCVIIGERGRTLIALEIEIEGEGFMNNAARQRSGSTNAGFPARGIERADRRSRKTLYASCIPRFRVFRGTNGETNGEGGGEEKTKRVKEGGAGGREREREVRGDAHLLLARLIAK